MGYQPIQSKPILAPSTIQFTDSQGNTHWVSDDCYTDVATIPYDDFHPNWYNYVTTCPIYPEPTPKPIHCPSCGAPLDHSRDRCEYCGTFA